jgi:hypothetical protein
VHVHEDERELRAVERLEHGPDCRRVVGEKYVYDVART